MDHEENSGSSIGKLTFKVQDLDIEKITNRSTIKHVEKERDDEFGDLEYTFETLIRHIQIEHRNMQVAKMNLAALNKNLEREIQVRANQLKQEVARSVNNSKFVALSEMAGGVAHEVNNPLAIILGRLNQLKRMQEKGSLTEGESLQPVCKHLPGCAPDHTNCRTTALYHLDRC